MPLRSQLDALVRDKGNGKHASRSEVGEGNGSSGRLQDYCENRVAEART